MSEPTNPYAIPQSNITLGVKEEEYGDISLFSSQGRIGRLRYMAYSFSVVYGSLLVAAILIFVFPHALDSTGYKLDGILIALGIGVLLCMFIPVFLSIQRLHDLNRSGWFLLLYAIPLLNIALALALFLMPGSEGRNQYGAPPPPNSLLVKILGTIPLIIMLLGMFTSIFYKSGF